MDITENMNEKKCKLPSYKYCRQNQVLIGMAYTEKIISINVNCFSHTFFIYIPIYYFYQNLGKSMVKTVEGFYCERCRRFMLLAEDMNAHLRSITHYRNFVAEVKSLTTSTAATESKETVSTEVSNGIL